MDIYFSPINFIIIQAECFIHLYRTDSFSVLCLHSTDTSAHDFLLNTWKKYVQFVFFTYQALNTTKKNIAGWYFLSLELGTSLNWDFLNKF